MSVKACLLAVWVVAGQPGPSPIEALIEESRAAASRRDDARADQAFREALELLAKIPPGDPREAKLNEVMGDAAVRRADYELADQLYSRSLAALDGPQRQSLDAARVSSSLGVVAASRNQASRAKDLYEVALKAHDALGPGSLEQSRVLDNLGILAMNGRDWPAAESRFRRALAIKIEQKALPGDRGATQSNLGIALLEQGRLEEARSQLKSAADLRRSQAPPLEMAVLLTRLARIERLGGQYDTAATTAREALELHRAQRTPTLQLAAAAHELGLSREAARAFGEALALYREALGLREKLAPQSAEVAESLERIAGVSAMSGDALAAINAFGRAVDAWARAAPNSLDHANVIHELGLLLVRRGDEDEGLRRLREAITVLDSAFSRGFGGTGAGVSGAGARRVQAYYETPIRILAERGDAGEAFSLLDRMRERLRCAGCDNAPASVAPIDALRGIEAGTLVVAFSVQSAATYAFVATRDRPMRVYRIDEARAALSDRVEKFVERVQKPSASAAYEAPLIAAGRSLFGLLFGQFEDEAGKAARLLIVADGPLERLPFSALVRNRSGVAKWQYLVDWKPMVFAPSVTAAAAWAEGDASPGSLGELFPASTAPAGARIVAAPMHRGALVSLWTPAASATDELAELFKASLSGRVRESALSRAQRVMRNRPGRIHPSYWAGFRYYGARGIR